MKIDGIHKKQIPALSDNQTIYLGRLGPNGCVDVHGNNGSLSRERPPWIEPESTIRELSCH